MRVIVVSETIQTFNGIKYYFCGSYFQHKGERLHRKVWEFYNGEVPDGYHVHHVDHERTNNQIENLHVLKRNEHLSHHSNTPENKAAKKIHMEKNMRPKAIEWHKSEAGRKWHSEHAKNRVIKRIKVVCSVCGESYETAHPSRSKFCSGKCKAKDLRRRRRENQGN